MRADVLFAGLFIAVANAKEYTLPPSFNANSISIAEKNAWCQGQLAACPRICPSGIAYKNTCRPGDLSFTCTCSDGKAPDVPAYENTIPFYVCEANYAQCINAHPDNLMGQLECKEQKKALCGTKPVPNEGTPSKANKPSPSLEDVESAGPQLNTASSSIKPASATATGRGSSKAQVKSDANVKGLSSAAIGAGLLGLIAAWV